MLSDSNWRDDLLNRKADAKVIIRFLLDRIAERRKRSMTASYVMNIDAGWGSGKTFFLSRLQKDLKEQGHCCVYFNAWENDHAEYPLIALMAGVDEEIGRSYPLKTDIKNSWERVKSSSGPLLKSMIFSAGKTALKRLVGEEGLSDIVNVISTTDDDELTLLGKAISASAVGAIDGAKLQDGNERIKQFQQTSRLITDFRKNLTSLVRSINEDNGFSRQGFILIDEMDRCRPSYAISLLEDIKHLFSVDGLVFIIATDTSQLSSSIKAIYGSEFDARRYLLRFFDRTYRFEKPTVHQFVSFLFSQHGIESNKLVSPAQYKTEDFIANIFDAFDLKLRDIEQCMDILASIMTLWKGKSKLNVTYLFPVIIAHHMGWSDVFADLANPESGLANTLSHKVHQDFTIQFGSSDFRRDDIERITFYRLLESFKNFYKLEPSELYAFNAETKSARWAKSVVSSEDQSVDISTVGGGANLHAKKYFSLVQNAGRMVDILGSEPI